MRETDTSMVLLINNLKKERTLAKYRAPLNCEVFSKQ